MPRAREAEAAGRVATAVGEVTRRTMAARSPRESGTFCAAEACEVLGVIERPNETGLPAMAHVPRFLDTKSSNEAIPVGLTSVDVAPTTDAVIEIGRAS